MRTLVQALCLMLLMIFGIQSASAFAFWGTR
jgi:hypothetical protein